MISKVGRVLVLFLVLLFVCAQSTPDVKLPEAAETQGDDTDELHQFMNDMDTSEEDAMDDNESMKKPEEYLEDSEETGNARIVKRNPSFSTSHFSKPTPTLPFGFFSPPIFPSTSTPARNSASPTPRFTPPPRVFPSKSTPLRNTLTSASPTSRLVVASRSILLTFQPTSGRPFTPTSGWPFPFTSRRPFPFTSRRPFPFTSRRPFPFTSRRPFTFTSRRLFTGCPLDCGKMNVVRRRSHSEIVYVQSHRVYICCRGCCRLYSLCLYFSYYSHPSVCYARALDCASRCRGFVRRYECRRRFRG